MESKGYKFACDELNEAIKDVNKALVESTPASQDTYVKTISRRNVATAKVAQAKPKEVLARLQRWKQIWVRTAFVLPLICSFATGVCAVVAFYYSLQLQIGCINGATKIAPFVLFGFISLLVHGRAALVGWT